MTNLIELKVLARNLKVLYAEDHSELRESFFKYLQKFFKNIVIAQDGQEALNYYKDSSFDIVITDIKMPNLDGLELVKEIRKINQEQIVIITSAYTDTTFLLDAIKLNVNSYILKPIDYNQLNETLLTQTKNIFNKKAIEDYEHNLEHIVEKKTKEQLENYQKTLMSLVELIEKRDSYTGSHSKRVAIYSKLIAKEMGYSDDDCNLIYEAGILHDIGKVVIPDSILLKPDKLNNLEYTLIKQHAEVAYEMLNKIPMYQKHAQIIRYHHERYDGKGYPDGKSAEDIPKLSRIMMVADAFDAMTTSRIYKLSEPIELAINELIRCKNKQFHPDVVDSAIKVLKDVNIEFLDQLPQTDMEKERFSYFFNDQLSKNIYNENYLMFMCHHGLLDKKYKFLYVIFLKNFSMYNEKNGWEEGNKFLSKIGDKIAKFDNQNLVFRIHGDDFFIFANTFDIYTLLKELVSLNEDYISYEYKQKELSCSDDFVFENIIQT